MGFTGSYFECKKCKHIIDYSDSHCPECGGQDEIDLNAIEVKKIAIQLLMIRDFNKNKIGERLLNMLELHDDLQRWQMNANGLCKNCCE